MFFFCCLGRGPGPAQTAKKNTPPPKQQKKTAPPPLIFLLFGRGACFFFAVWAGDVFFFAVWAFRLFFFLLFGRGRVLFFAVWAGGVFFFFAVWAGDGSSLTYPSAWLVFKRPNNKRDRTAKKKHGFRPNPTKTPIRNYSSSQIQLLLPRMP